MDFYGQRTLSEIPRESIDKIFTEAERIYKVSRESVLGKRRTSGVVHARFFVYRKLRGLGLSYPLIGAICNRAHSAVVLGCRKAKELESWGLIGRSGASFHATGEFDSHPQARVLEDISDITD